VIEIQPPDEEGDSWSETKAQVNGSVVHMTGVFGFNLAGLFVQDVVRQTSAL
jgi:tRNA A37 threonylcarbamoyladenosine dehydratase